MKLKTFAMNASAALMMAVGLYSCSSSDEGMYGYLSSDKLMYMSVNLREVYDNAGFEITADGVKPSEAFMKVVDGANAGKALTVLNMRGINLDNVVMMIDASDNNENGILVFTIEDKDKFASYLKENDLTATNDNGVEVYSMKNNTAIIVDGDYGLLVDLQDDASATVKAFKEAAAKNPLKSWQKEALSKSNTLAMVMNVNEFYKLGSENAGAAMPSLEKLGYPKGEDCYGVFTSSLSGLEWNGEYGICDAEGKTVKFDIEFYPPVTSLLDYTDSKDCAVLLGAMPKDFDYSGLLATIDNVPASATKQISAVLNTIHSVMLAGGPLDITSYNSGEGWTGVLAVALAPGSAQEYLNMLKVLGSQAEVPMQKSENEITVSDFYGINASLKADGDNLVLAVNTPADAKRSSFKASEFGNTGGMIIDIPANTPSTTLLSIPFGVKYNMTTNMNEKSTTSLKLTDTQGKLLQNIIEFVASKK